jgi:hypothetical protein
LSSSLLSLQDRMITYFCRLLVSSLRPNINVDVPTSGPALIVVESSSKQWHVVSSSNWPPSLSFSWCSPSWPSGPLLSTGMATYGYWGKVCSVVFVVAPCFERVAASFHAASFVLLVSCYGFYGLYPLQSTLIQQWVLFVVYLGNGGSNEPPLALLRSVLMKLGRKWWFGPFTSSLLTQQHSLWSWP